MERFPACEMIIARYMMDIEFLLREFAENPKRIKGLATGVTKTEARF
jgi:hypothetical protein